MEDSGTKIMKYAVLIAIASGIAVSVYLILAAKGESYSALFIRSHTNYIENGTVTFTYGVDRFGPAGERYDFRVMVRGTEYYSKGFDMQPGRMEENVTLRLNETSFPVKVQLVLRGSGGEVLETFFWLNGAR